jgi:septal ring factor EnvC (AmiA/AmiB activator)
VKSVLWPGDFPVSQAFGENAAVYARFRDAAGRPLRGHNGVDVALPIGTRLRAPEAGTLVESSLDAGGYGHTYYLAADSGRGWRLAHLFDRPLAAGARVAAGQAIGRSGTSGFSTGPHLHLGLRPRDPEAANGYNGYINPVPLLADLEADVGRIDELEAALVALRGDLDQALGRERDLAAQLAAVREQLASRDSELGALRTHVVAPLEERLAAAQRAIEAQLTELAAVNRELTVRGGDVEGATVRLVGGRTVELVPA